MATENNGKVADTILTDGQIIELHDSMFLRTPIDLGGSISAGIIKFARAILARSQPQGEPMADDAQQLANAFAIATAGPKLSERDIYQRAIGRAEAAQIIINLSAEDALDHCVGCHPSGDFGEWDAHWKEDELRKLLRADEAAWSLVQETEDKFINLQCEISQKEMDAAFFNEPSAAPVAQPVTPLQATDQAQEHQPLCNSALRAEPAGQHKFDVEALAKALRRAYNYGQTYWQQADSEYISQQKKSDATAEKFASFVDEECGKFTAITSEVLALAKSGMSYGLLADDYCSQIVTVIEAATAEQSNMAGAARQGGVTKRKGDCLNLGDSEVKVGSVGTTAEASEDARDAIAWMRPGFEPEFTADAQLAGYWMRKGSTVTPLFAATVEASDTERLDFMASHELRIGWDREGEKCRVWRTEEEGEMVPVCGWKNYFDSAREAIDAAISAMAPQKSAKKGGE